MAIATVTADAPVVPTWGGGGGRRARAGQAVGWALTVLDAGPGAAWRSCRAGP